MYLSKTNSSVMPGRGLINPAFVIKIVSATDELQQKNSSGRDNPNDDFLSSLKTGTDIEAKVDDKKITGTVSTVIKNAEGDVILVKMIDTNGKTHKIEATSIVKRKKFGDDNRDKLTSSPAIFAESKFLCYSEFNSI